MSDEIKIDNPPEQLYTGYSIKYIETKGIMERVGRLYSSRGDPDCQYLTKPGNGLGFFERLGKDVFLDRRNAVDAAVLRLTSRIKGLDKKRKRLDAQLEQLKQESKG